MLPTADAGSPTHGGKYPATVEYVCKDGFQHNGSHTSKSCTSTGAWIGSIRCVGIECPIPPKVANAQSGPPSNGGRFPSSLTYTCAEGFQFDNSNGKAGLNFCRSDGTWTDLVKCQARTCKEPPVGWFISNLAKCQLSQCSVTVGFYPKSSGGMSDSCEIAACTQAPIGTYYTSNKGSLSSCAYEDCTNALEGQFYTGNHRNADACPVDDCQPCPHGRYRSDCGGKSPGTCLQQDPQVLTLYKQPNNLLPNETGSNLSDLTKQPVVDYWVYILVIGGAISLALILVAMVVCAICFCICYARKKRGPTEHPGEYEDVEFDVVDLRKVDAPEICGGVPRAASLDPSSLTPPENEQCDETSFAEQAHHSHHLSKRSLHSQHSNRPLRKTSSQRSLHSQHSSRSNSNNRGFARHSSMPVLTSAGKSSSRSTRSRYSIVHVKSGAHSSHSASQSNSCGRSSHSSGRSSHSVSQSYLGAHASHSVSKSNPGGRSSHSVSQSNPGGRSSNAAIWSAFSADHSKHSLLGNSERLPSTNSLHEHSLRKASSHSILASSSQRLPSNHSLLENASQRPPSSHSLHENSERRSSAHSLDEHSERRSSAHSLGEHRSSAHSLFANASERRSTHSFVSHNSRHDKHFHESSERRSSQSFPDDHSASRTDSPSHVSIESSRYDDGGSEDETNASASAPQPPPPSPQTNARPNLSLELGPPPAAPSVIDFDEVYVSTEFDPSDSSNAAEVRSIMIPRVTSMKGIPMQIPPSPPSLMTPCPSNFKKFGVDSDGFVLFQ